LTNVSPEIRIVVDAMGGDFAPASVVRGSLDALRERPGAFTVILVGPRDRIGAELKAAGSREDASGGFAVEHASEVIDMSDAPTAAVKSKKNSSIAVGLAMQRSGRAEAFVSAGNTGAVLSASTLILGRLPHVGRPTIGALLPTAKKPCLLLDAGANVDCRPRHLFEFGVMGLMYAGAMLGNPSPTVGLLNIGEERSKGNEAAREAHRLFAESSLPFKGNVEGRDILSGDVDVVVCDGFTGNILLKFGESIPGFFKAKFTQRAAHSLVQKAVGLVARGSLRAVMKEMDYQEHGGVPVLGVNGVAIIGHGRSTPRAVKNMIFRAQEMVLRGVHRRIEESMMRVQTHLEADEH
jgi:glycerol-3-phosphate acyltransferase PlsX